MAESVEEIKKATKSYLIVFGILLLGTVITYLVATTEFLDFGGHGFDVYDCVLGLAIATFKATCVAYVFMHLNHEKKAIYWIFFGSFVFVAFMAFLISFAYQSHALNLQHLFH